MKLQFYTPRPELRSLISKLWVFESDTPIPNKDLKLIVPNGMIKLVIPFRNGLHGRFPDWSYISKENCITLIGTSDVPAKVEPYNGHQSGTIGIEFSLLGAYRFFDLHFNDIKDTIHPLTDIYGKTARELESMLTDAENVAQKIFLIQDFLYKQMQRQQQDMIFDYCIDRMVQYKGRITVKQLEKETGYTSRWINTKFNNMIGSGPKTLSSILRFQQFYTALAANNEKNFFKKDFYDYYYDQSHFIKDFKRFTGLSPTKFAMSENEMGKIFYKN